MSADQETVTSDQPTRFPHTRAEALRTWEEFRPRVVTYADARNGVRPVTVPCRGCRLPFAVGWSPSTS